MIEIETIEGVITIDLSTVTLDDVDGIISNLSVDVEIPTDTITVLYSGPIADYSSSKIVTQMDNVRIIDNTEVAYIKMQKKVENYFQKGIYIYNIQAKDVCDGKIV